MIYTLSSYVEDEDVDAVANVSSIGVSNDSLTSAAAVESIETRAIEFDSSLLLLLDVDLDLTRQG